MAPNATERFSTHYGALNLKEEDVSAKPKTVSEKLLLLSGVMVLTTFVVFFATAGVTSRPVAAVVNAVPENAVPGRAGSNPAADCACLTDCAVEITLDALGNELHYCDVDGLSECSGVDGRTFKQSPGYVEGADCTVAGNCRAACDYLEGRYDCWSFPCFNGAFCLDGVDAYTCACQFGFAGANCEQDINECEILDTDEDDDGADEQFAVCDVHAACANSYGRYSCECNAGWEGDGYRETGVLSYNYPSWIVRPADDDEYLQACRDIDDCAGNPCHNGATCINLEGIYNSPPEEYGYDCECALGLTGSRAWVGHDCDEDVDECDENAPLHDCDTHATCSNQEGSFACFCNEHWQSTDPDGVNREGRAFGRDNSNAGCYDWSDCGSSPCENGGTCSEGPDGCEENNAETGGVDFVDCYTCACAYGYTGFNCEIDENECSNSEEGAYVTLTESCHDEAFCTNTPGSFECACNAGWTGDGITCIDADDCEFSPCAHGGTCYDCGTLCFSCDCVVGWRGTTCATDWNECIMGIHMCNDDATCVNNPGSYDCRCDPGFTGTGFGQGFSEDSQTYTIGSNTVTEITFRGCKDIDDCDSDLYEGPTLSPNGPCVKGLCTDLGPNAFNCLCDAGYTDTTCDQDINECDPILGDNDCHRFATCKNVVGSFTCACNEGYTGNGYSSCLDVSDCYSQCINGFCSDLGTDAFRCTCDDGYMDMKCDRNINECATYTHQCARHSLCTDTDGSYTCACNGGWSGDGMSQGSGCRDIDDCASNPCDFGACTDQGAKAYTCECQEGFTDFNCDFDINECYLKTHNCHVDARCVNMPGGFFCRCLSGWEGDGLTCTDLDDCDPDPCDPIHGTCEDRGANKYECVCMPGWTGIECGDDEDECFESTHGCDGAALCTNTFGSHECVCKVDFYGDGTLCTPCTTCGAGWKPEGICEEVDLTCVNVDECASELDNCHEHATCTDGEGSFKCACDQNGDGDEWWGVGTNDNDGCRSATVCYDGYHEVQPTTTGTDRICEINVVSGLYMIESEADDNKMCVAMMQGEWYPSRMNFGNGDDFCGSPGATEREQKKALMADGQAIFKIQHIGNENDQEIKLFGDYYTISHNAGKGFQCLFFGNKGQDIYPSMQSCMAYDIADKDACPWAEGGNDAPYCGFSDAGEDAYKGFVDNMQAVWKITPLKLNEKKYILQSASKGTKTQSGDPIWECLAFEEQGAATNPSRYNWGNGDTWCGAGNWEGQGKVVALLNNKQAVMILTFLQAA